MLILLFLCNIFEVINREFHLFNINFSNILYFHKIRQDNLNSLVCEDLEENEK